MANNLRNNKSELSDCEEVQYIWNDEQIREFVKGEISKHPGQKHVHLSSSQMKWDIISQTGCVVKEADAIFQRMLDLGLSMCKDIIPISGEKDSYDLTRFCNLRGYQI